MKNIKFTTQIRRFCTHVANPEIKHTLGYSRASPSFWKQKSNQRQYFDWLSEQLGIQKSTDWYSLPKGQLFHYPQFTSIIHNYHNNSLITALQNIYPEYEWHPDHFLKSPQRHWKSPQNQRSHMDWVANELHIQTQEDWYKIQIVDVLKLPRTASLLKYWKNSLSAALKTVYPEFSWCVWKFQTIPKHSWSKGEFIKDCVEDIAESLGVSNPFQWLTISANRLRNIRAGRGVLTYFRNSFQLMLESVYPNFDWHNVNRMSLGEQTLHLQLKRIFRQHTIIRCQQMEFGELDFYIPELFLAFEYQGAQHYRTFNSEAEYQKNRDEFKRNKCREMGITLIQVGYWWNGSLGSLITTLQRLRPDIQLHLQTDHYITENCQLSIV